MAKIQLVFLGKQKQPNYARTEEDIEKEVIKWYKTCYNTNYRVGDGFVTSTEEQYAFGCPKNLEVYRVHTFEEENGFTIDKDLVSLEDFIEENCENLIEIYNEFSIN